MRWFYCNKENLVGLECVNGKTDKHILRLSPNKNIIKNEEERQGDTRFISVFVNNKPTVKDIKNILLSLQTEYDSSSEVNSFYLNGKRIWLDKATRVGLVNVLNLEKLTGKTDTILWLDTTSISISIERALAFLTNIEIYAKECYNNTHKHFADINNLETIEECLAFDITSGYPNKLNIEIK